MCVCVVQDAKGALVWGKAVGFSLWPAINKSSKEEYPLKMVEWYGQKLSSLVSQASNSDMIDAEVVLTCRESEFIPANNIIMHI